MLPALQPSRPKVQPNQSPRPGYAQQQKRSINDQPSTHSNPLNQAPNYSPARPRNQLEAMPPFGPAQAAMLPPRALYDSAIRHPVFFGEQLRKPPFAIPNMASQGYNPVASGYIVESKKVKGNGGAKGKL